jgi:hypothetical protein
MPKFGYDLKNIERAMASIRMNPRSQSNLNRLRTELNKFFPEATCNNVFYSDNKDKLFFGMAVVPSLTDEQVAAIALADGDDKDLLRVKQYSIDIDSKLLDSLVLTDKELTAIVLHEVGHLVIDDSPAKIVQRNMDMYFKKNRTQMDANQLSYCPDVIRYGIEDAMVKAVSLWYRDEEVAADSFVVACGYGPELETALNKIGTNAYSMAKGANVPKFIMLYWSLRVYKEVHLKRVAAVKTLDRAAAIEGSTLQKNKMTYLKKRLLTYVAPIAAVKGDIQNPISDVQLKEMAALTESFLVENKLFANLKTAGLRSIENDYYEYQMRLNNVEDELDALQLLREINNRMSALDNYLASPKISEGERKKYLQLYNGYFKLREILSKKKIWKKSQYGLYYNYNDLTPAQMQSYEPM